MTADLGDVERRQWVFIAGHDRSGSTLVGALLEQQLDAFFCGELHVLWRALVSGWLCGCGDELARCPLWSTIAAEALVEAGLRDNRAAADVMAERLRRRHLLAPRLPRPRAAELSLRRATEAAVVRNVANPVIIDSSKLSSVLWTAAQIPRPLGVIHLVRDSRAVAFSQGRTTPSPARRGAPMHRRSMLASASDWFRAHLTTERVLRRHGKVPAPMWVARLRYEDLTSEGPGALDGVLNCIGPTHRRVDSSADRTGSHVIGGNVVRLAGRSISPNTRWQDEMGRVPHVVVTGLTLPMLRRYHYPVNGRRRQRGSVAIEADR